MIRTPSEYIKIFRVLSHLRRRESFSFLLFPSLAQFFFSTLHFHFDISTDKFFFKICSGLTVCAVEHVQFLPITGLSIIIRYYLQVRPGPLYAIPRLKFTVIKLSLDCHSLYIRMKHCEYNTVLFESTLSPRSSRKQ